MRFCRSTHLLMFLSLETSIIRTGLPILVELIVLVNSVYNFSISNDLTQIVNFPSQIPDDCDSHSPALLDFFFFSIKTFIIYKQTIYSQQKLKYDWNVTNNKHYLKTYAIKIVRIKQYRRNKMYNENHNDIYDNNNISNKNQLDLSLSNV